MEKHVPLTHKRHCRCILLLFKQLQMHQNHSCDPTPRKVIQTRTQKCHPVAEDRFVSVKTTISSTYALKYSLIHVQKPTISIYYPMHFWKTVYQKELRMNMVKYHHEMDGIHSQQLSSNRHNSSSMIKRTFHGGVSFLAHCRAAKVGLASCQVKSSPPALSLVGGNHLPTEEKQTTTRSIHVGKWLKVSDFGNFTSGFMEFSSRREYSKKISRHISSSGILGSHSPTICSNPSDAAS